MPSYEDTLGDDVGSLDAVLTLSRIGYDSYKRAPSEDTLRDAIQKLRLAQRLITTAIERPRPGEHAPENKLQEALRKRLKVVDRRLGTLVGRADPGVDLGIASPGSDRGGGCSAAGSPVSERKQHPRWAYQQKFEISQRQAALEKEREAAEAERLRLEAAELVAAATLAESEAEAARVEQLQAVLSDTQQRHAADVTDLQQREARHAVEEAVTAVVNEIERAELESEQLLLEEQTAAAKAEAASAALAVQAERTAAMAES